HQPALYRGGGADRADHGLAVGDYLLPDRPGELRRWSGGEHRPVGVADHLPHPVPVAVVEQHRVGADRLDPPHQLRVRGGAGDLVPLLNPLPGQLQPDRAAVDDDVPHGTLPTRRVAPYPAPGIPARMRSFPPGSVPPPSGDRRDSRNLWSGHPARPAGSCVSHPTPHPSNREFFRPIRRFQAATSGSRGTVIDSPHRPAWPGPPLPPPSAPPARPR